MSHKSWSHSIQRECARITQANARSILAVGKQYFQQGRLPAKPLGKKKAEEREEDTVAEGIVKTEAFPPTIPSACAQVKDENKVKRPVAGGFSPSFGKSFSVCDCIVFFLFLS